MAACGQLLTAHLGRRHPAATRPPPSRATRLTAAALQSACLLLQLQRERLHALGAHGSGQRRHKRVSAAKLRAVVQRGQRLACGGKGQQEACSGWCRREEGKGGQLSRMRAGCRQRVSARGPAARPGLTLARQVVQCTLLNGLTRRRGWAACTSLGRVQASTQGQRQAAAGGAPGAASSLM